jgi:predicted house-cleaning NTP pyrophosphatase (Maf/HAM1 superfamily)
MSPSIADAPAASPEQSDIVESVHTPSAPLDLEIIPHSPSLNNDAENSSIPSVLFNKIPIKSSYLDIEGIQNQCDCYAPNDISEQSDIDETNDNDEEQEEEQKKKSKRKSKVSIFCDQYIWSRFRITRKYISNFVASKYFRRIVLSAIVVNTLSMGIEYHGQPPSLTNALEYSNLVFTSLFAIEMILKIIADGCLKYIKNAYNLFDGGIVLMSVIELQGNTNSGLSVLRTFRLLRVLKLVRFMPTLRRQLVREREIL